ncbi:hypothetical protein WJX81_008261 [Elliptochloris bilobata]|uniref:Uncharacterized protein n=1 Tax=Elliptochloris bilobata TaxID=381761 RepID=A0AAW1QL67_9CHLO
MKKAKSCKVYYSILAICYLEVLFWTTCLLTSCATSAARPEDANYIARETDNLKHTYLTDSSESLPGSVDLRGGDLHQYLERLSLQRLKQATLFPPVSEQRPVSINFLPVLKGVPAPYTGVQALSEPARA